MIKDYLAGDDDYILSLNKLNGKKIKDIHGYISTEFGEPIFKLTDVLFEDGTTQGAEGEHDCPYLVDYDEKTEKILEDIVEEERQGGLL